MSTIRHLRTGPLEHTYQCWASCRMILNMIFRLKWCGQWGLRVVPTRINLYPRGAVRVCVSGQAGGKETPSEYVSAGCIFWAVEMRPVLAQFQSLFFAVLPCSLPSRWYARTLHLCIDPMFELMLVFPFMSFVVTFAPFALPSLESLVSSLPH